MIIVIVLMNHIYYRRDDFKMMNLFENLQLMKEANDKELLLIESEKFMVIRY